MFFDDDYAVDEKKFFDFQKMSPIICGFFSDSQFDKKRYEIEVRKMNEGENISIYYKLRIILSYVFGTHDASIDISKAERLTKEILKY